MARKFEITILGVNSAFPVHGRHPSCQIVNYDDKLIMIDCGEGSQIQISKYKIKRARLDHIFISHLHGDHCYGLPGLLTSFALEGRHKRLSLHGPIGLKLMINTILEVSRARLSYELEIIEYDTLQPTQIIINSSLQVLTFPLQHRIPTMGFRVNEVISDYNINSECIPKFKLSIEEIKSIKKGGNIIRDGRTILNQELTLKKHEPRSYTYCSDTIYDISIVPFIKNSSLLYHETTYLDGLETIAKERMHSTLGQAIKIAKLAEIERLIIGHFSSRYSDLDVFLKEGLPEFKGLLLGEEGRIYSI